MTTNLRFLYWSLILLVVQFSCSNESKQGICPDIVIPDAPYDDPVWHPSGNIIGFNHKPIREIKYDHTSGCNLTTYSYQEDSAGFWLINADGTNQRRVLPYYLYTPSWSPDGKWIAFMQGAQIYKVPFDGEHFDTTGIEQLTFEGRNFYPAWHPEGGKIAYDNTVCGSAASPPPLNSCGILIIDHNGDSKSFITERAREPYFSPTGEGIIFIGYKSAKRTLNGIFYYDLLLHIEYNIYKTDSNDYNLSKVQYSSNGLKIAFVKQTLDSKGTQLWTINPDGSNIKQLTTEGAQNFSWSQDGRIVYSNFDWQQISESKGTLWIMDSDGSNKHQLTFNHFMLSQ